MKKSPLIGLILAGGVAKRFGGGKCLAKLGDNPLIFWVYHSLSAVCPEIWLSLRKHEKAYENLRPRFEKILLDKYPGTGPAAAISAALEKAQRPLLVAPCDQPFILPLLLKGLINTWEKDPHLETVIFKDETGRLLPFPGIYGRGNPEPQGLSLRALIEQTRYLIVEPRIWRKWDPQGLSFFNVNRKEDLKRATEILKDPAALKSLSL